MKTKIIHSDKNSELSSENQKSQPKTIIDTKSRVKDDSNYNNTDVASHNTNHRQDEPFQPPQNNSLIGLQIGNYKIIDTIGSGGMGTVYLGENVHLSNQVAIKCLNPEYSTYEGLREALKKEAGKQSSLVHNNIIQLTDFYVINDQFFLQMEYVKGIDLDKKIQNSFNNEKEVLNYIKQILDGLQFAHGIGIVHRDIKPSNIIIDNNGIVKIMDFGIAMHISSESHKKEGLNAYTTQYASPEQISLSSEIDHRCDVYAAGTVLYEMFTKQIPYHGSDDQIKHQKSSYSNPIHINNIQSEIHPRLAEIIMQSIEPDPDKRFDGCGDFLQNIEEYERLTYVECPNPNCRVENKVLDSSKVTGLKCIACGTKLDKTKMPWKIIIFSIILLLMISSGTLWSYFYKISYHTAHYISTNMLELEETKTKIPIIEELEDFPLLERYKKQCQQLASNVVEGFEKRDSIPNIISEKAEIKYMEDQREQSPLLTQYLKRAFEYIPICYEEGVLNKDYCILKLTELQK